MATKTAIHAERLIPITACSLAHQLCVLLVYMALMDADPLHPITWLKGCFSSLLSSRTFIFMVATSLLTVMKSIFLSKRLIRGSTFSHTRMMAVVNTFCFDNVICLTLNLLIGLAMGYMYTTMKAPQEEGREPGQIFKLLCMSFTSIYYFFDDYVNGSHCIQLPPISGLSAKSQLLHLVKKGIVASLWPGVKSLFYFNLLYYICGESLVYLPGICISGCSSEVLRFNELFDTSHIISSYVLCVTVLTVLSTFKSIATMFLACSWKFPVVLPNDDHILLSQALAADSPHAVKQLACQDMIAIAETDPARRAELYVLSQPGGHPHNWKNIVKPFLATIDKMCIDLSLSQPSETLKPTQSIEDVYFPPPPNVRNLSPRPAGQTMPNSNAVPPICTSLCLKAREWLQQQLEFFLKKPPIAFFFGERTEARIAHALTLHGQAVANLVSGVSTFVQASYTEDAFGVVQQDLPSLIVALLKLKGAIDRLGNLYRKPTKLSQSSPHLHVKSALREATVRSIYKIVITFKPHINDLLLPTDVKNQLQGFVQFKES